MSRAASRAFDAVDYEQIKEILRLMIVNGVTGPVADKNWTYIPRGGASFSFVRVMPKYAGRLVRLRAFRGVAPRA